MVVKKITSLVCALALSGACVFGSGVPTVGAVGSITATSGCKSSLNIIDTSPHSLDNQDKTVKSYLYQSGDNQLTRVECVYDENNNHKVIAEDINMTTGELIKSRTLEMALPAFGGFYVGENYLFLVTGDANLEQSDDQKILAVTRITKDFKKYKNKYLYGRNTYIPFDAGSCRMTEAGGKLYVHTCHLMYQSSDGYHHQANMSYVFDIETLDIEQEHYTVSSSGSTGKLNDAFGYMSHSFDQFIVSDENSVYAYDHGDAYSRSLRLHRYDLKDGYLRYSDLVSIPGGIGDNYTGVLTGSVTLSTDNVLVGLKMADMSGGSLDAYTDLKDVYIAVYPKASIGTSAACKLVNLTNYEDKAGSSRRNSAPKIVKINDDRFIVLWKEMAQVRSYYVFVDGVLKRVTDETDPTVKIAVIDGSGELIGDISENSSLNLSVCDPILCSDGMVRWYCTNSGEPVIYALDPDDPANFGTPGDANGDGEVSILDVLIIRQYMAGWGVDINLSNADVNGDGKVDILDVLLLRQYLAGWNVEFKTKA